MILYGILLLGAVRQTCGTNFVYVSWGHPVDCFMPFSEVVLHCIACVLPGVHWPYAVHVLYCMSIFSLLPVHRSGTLWMDPLSLPSAPIWQEPLSFPSLPMGRQGRTLPFIALQFTIRKECREGGREITFSPFLHRDKKYSWQLFKFILYFLSLQTSWHYSLCSPEWCQVTWEGERGKLHFMQRQKMLMTIIII